MALNNPYQSASNPTGARPVTPRYRVPQGHAASHAAGGSDPIELTRDSITDLFDAGFINDLDIAPTVSNITDYLLIETSSGLQRLALGYVTNYKDTISTNDPGVGNDLTQGYSVGSIWTNAVSKTVWICVDFTIGAAVWKDITNHTEVATTLNAASEKSTPVDADRIPLTDSADTFALKWFSWANLKATVKAYLDTFYMLAATYDPTAVAGDAFDMDNMVEGATTKILTDTERTKLAGIETGADVTDTTNVDAAGAVMNSDASTAAMSFVVDEDNMASDSATKVPTQQSVKAYVDSGTASIANKTLDNTNVLTGAKMQIEENAQSGTSYTFVLSDASKLVSLTNAAAIALTVPPNSSVAFPVGTQILIAQGGAGQVTVGPGSGVTIKSRDSLVKITGQEGIATLIKTATDTWRLAGDLSA